MLGGGLMMLAMLSMAFMSVGQGGKQRKAQIYGDRRDYLRYLDLMRERVRAVADQQRASLVWQHPHPHALWAVAASRRLWERRTTDADFAQVRVGLGSQRLATTIVPPDTGLLEDLESVSAVALRRFVRAHSTVPHLPIAVSLRVVQPRRAGRRARPRPRTVARAMIGQLCALHSPGRRRRRDLRGAGAARELGLGEVAPARAAPHARATARGTSGWSRTPGASSRSGSRTSSATGRASPRTRRSATTPSCSW